MTVQRKKTTTPRAKSRHKSLRAASHDLAPISSAAYRRQILRSVFQILKVCGASRQEVEAAIGDELRRGFAASSATPRADEVQHLHRFAQALRIWHTNPEYLTRRGEPRPLPLHGKRDSIMRLLVQAGVEQPGKSAVAAMLRNQFVVRSSARRYIPTQRMARARVLDTIVANHVAQGVSEFLRTVHYNLSSRGRRQPLLERTAHVEFLPAQHTKAFRQFAASQGNAALIAIDNWLEARATKPKSGARRRGGPAGVFMFSYQR